MSRWNRIRNRLKQAGNKGLWATSVHEKMMRKWVDEGFGREQSSGSENPRARVHSFYYPNGGKLATFQGNVEEFSRFLREQELIKRKTFPLGTIRFIAAGVRGNFRRFRKWIWRLK